MDLKKRWHNFVTALNPAATAQITERWWRLLKREYGNPVRHYHGLSHVADCMQELDNSRQPIAFTQVAEFALWFHDVVYTPGAKDNETKSCELAKQCAVDLGLSEDFASMVKECILATRHDGAKYSPLASIVADIDLAVLGQEAGEFESYEQAIRREYSDYGDEAYRIGRASFLSGFLARPTIYSTPYFFRLYEKQARANISHLISRLSA